MPRKSKETPSPRATAPRRRGKAHAREPSPAAKSFTIPQFIQRNPMSANTYYAMRAQGRGPREFRPTGKPNGVVLISEEAERDWIAANEKRNAKEKARCDALRAERKAAKKPEDVS